MGSQNNHQNLKEKISLRRLLIALLIVLATTAVVVGLIWWKLNPIIETQNDFIKSLEDQIKTTSEKIHNFSSD